VPLSFTIEHGNPCNLTILSKKALATEEAEYGWLKGMKWANFEKRSTTIKMTDLPPTLVNPSMKSIVVSLHISERTVTGCSSPAG
jgi:hypothetical protein